MAQASPSASPTSPLQMGTEGPGGELVGLIDSRTATIERMRSSILSGAYWAEALLAAVGRWTAPSETVDGLHIQYLVGGEAFDWLLLAERLLRVVPDGRVPIEDRDRLLFKGMLPAGRERYGLQERAWTGEVPGAPQLLLRRGRRGGVVACRRARNREGAERARPAASRWGAGHGGGAVVPRGPGRARSPVPTRTRAG